MNDDERRRHQKSTAKLILYAHTCIHNGDVDFYADLSTGRQKTHLCMYRYILYTGATTQRYPVTICNLYPFQYMINGIVPMTF